MPITKLTPENNYPYTQERLKELEQAVPEAFADGKINWDKLREVLGEDLEGEGCEEYFGLNWPGKREARKRAAAPIRGTLVPAPGEGVNEETTENLFIEGDNLEVLKLLRKSYAGKIKMIYIDPPYNTGNDFIYNDNFTDPLEAYLDYTGATGESGELLTNNTRADGRFHSKWLNMMYPRLILAHQLLAEDGVIFVSIDDNEVHHLRQMMNEIFSETNFVEQFTVRSNPRGNQAKKLVASEHDYILCYSKENQLISPLGHSVDIREYNKTDKLGNYREIGLRKRGAGSRRIDAPNQYYPIYYDPKTEEISTSKKVGYVEILPKLSDGTDGRWRWSFSTVEEEKWKLTVRLVNKGSGQHEYDIFEKDYFTVDKITKIKSIFYEKQVNFENATEELKELFGNKVFSYPKPVYTIRKLIESINTANCLVMDFFAGSATTAQAILEQNTIDFGTRKFLLIQFPEIISEEEEAFSLGYKTIADVGKERIRRAIIKIEDEQSKEVAKAPLLQNNKSRFDRGFKVFKYSRSNYKEWNPPIEDNVEALAPLFANLSDPLISGWKKEDLLTQILLLEGFPLTSKTKHLEEFLKNEFYRVSAPGFCAHNLFICLDDEIHPDTIDLLTMEKEDIFICLDSALSDELKANVQDKFNVHVI